MIMVCKQGLPWPVSKKRTPAGQRKFGQFKYEGVRIPLYRAVERLEREIGAFTRHGRSGRTRQLTLCCGHYAYVNGQGFKADSRSDDPGVVVSFDLDGKGYTVACDTYTTCADNFAAIAAYIEGLRAQERHGVAGLDEMLAGHAALPSAGAKPFWWNVLGLDPTATKDEVLAAHKRLIFECHPDRGGDPDKAAAINAARDEALEQLG